MKKIVCIGNTLLTVKAAEEIRRLDPDSEITIFCSEGCLPYDASRLPDLVGKTLNSQETIFVPDSFFKERNIAVVLDKKIARVYLKRKRVVTQEKEQFPYDVLLIEDKGAIRFPEVKGSHKKGVFHLRTQQDVQQLVNDLSLAEVVSIEVDNLFLLQMACALREHKKDVLVICPDGYLLPQSLDRHTAQIVSDLLEDNGIRVIFNNTITEVLGNGDAKAVRLKTGKVLESHMVVLSGAYRDVTLFDVEEAGLVDNKGYSQAEDMFIFEEFFLKNGDGVKKDLFEYLTLYIDHHAKQISQATLGQPSDPVDVFRSLSLKIFGHRLALLGDTRQKNSVVEYLKNDQLQKIYRKIFVKDNKIIGAAFLNAGSQEPMIQSYMEQNITIDQLSHHILEEPRDGSAVSTHQQDVASLGDHAVSTSAFNDQGQECPASQQNDSSAAQEIEGTSNIS